MEKIEWDKVKTRLDALLVIDEYRTDPDNDWLRLIVKTEENCGIFPSPDKSSGVRFSRCAFITHLTNSW